MPIVIENLTHIYAPGTPYQSYALKDINLTVRDGEILGVIGHTGSGKTTLVQHINGLLQPTSGRIVVDGVDYTKRGADLKKLRQTVGLVFQYPEYQLFEETVEKDIAFGPSRMGIKGEELAERVWSAMKMVELDYSLRDKSPIELSGGEKRRAAIAGVLAMRPKTLILDEPTAGLDPRGRRSVLELVERINRSGTTVIMVSHSMDDLAALAHRVAVMNMGELVMTGTVREVFSCGEWLAEIGLEQPQLARLVMQMRKRGYDIPMFMDIESMAQYIADRIDGKNA